VDNCLSGLGEFPPPSNNLYPSEKDLRRDFIEYQVYMRRAFQTIYGLETYGVVRWYIMGRFMEREFEKIDGSPLQKEDAGILFNK
jgi:hypothetical protein